MPSVLSQPKHARCDNRRLLARVNPVLGEPEKWLTDLVLQSRGYAKISFDFFVNWRTMRCSDEIWIKRISSIDVSLLCDAGNEYLAESVRDAGDDLQAIHDFAQSQQLRAFYQIFRDDVDWLSSPEAILGAEVVSAGFGETRLQSLRELIAHIRMIRGGPVNIGAKGLTYGSSTLECFLSRTNDIWPGDVDCVLWSTASRQIHAIVEFKKHTLANPVREQQLGNYYPRPDGRKYDSLALLRDRLDARIPLLIVYYPTNAGDREIKIERVSGACGALRSTDDQVVSTTRRQGAELGSELLNAARSLIEEG